MYKRFKKKRRVQNFEETKYFSLRRIEKISKMNIQYNVLASKQRNR